MPVNNKSIQRIDTDDLEDEFGTAIELAHWTEESQDLNSSMMFFSGKHKSYNIKLGISIGGESSGTITKGEYLYQLNKDLSVRAAELAIRARREARN